MSGLLLVVAALLVVRGAGVGAAGPTEDVVIEVRGDVPAPGYHALRPPVTLEAALAAAGAGGRDVADAVIRGGTRVVVDGDSVSLHTMDELLVVGLPIDINQASAAALEALPGLGPARAAAIVSERIAAGPYADVDALQRVRGIGPGTVARLRPFLVAESPKPRP
ncbi:MAG: ComEA family DNA-binding protein [Myxococcota bacterium]|nr:ComEA family DNA-binding protein [Myxococcota bacterium]